MKSLATASASLLLAPAWAQNLVPNGSFEEYTDCPTYFGQWMEVVDWTSPYTASADYFNGCAEDTICGVPFNHFGFQWPSEGNGYMGLATFSYNDPDYREIILAELTQPLEIGVPVAMAMDVACGGWGSWGPNSARWKARGPGLKFFSTPPDDWSAYLYPNEAPLHMDTVLADTTDWTRLTGLYVPDSAYRYVAITNFFEDSLSWPSVQEGAGFFGCAYAFVDNLCVSPDPQVCFGGQGILEARKPNVHLAIDPTSGELTLWSDRPLEAPSSVQVVDQSGRLVTQGQWPASRFSYNFPIRHFSAGIYLLTIPEAHVALRFVVANP